MEGDPFARMMELIRGEQRAGGAAVMRIGTVVTDAPLRIETAGLRLEPEALRIDRRLKETLEREIAAGTRTTLLPGSKALLLTDDDQTYFILCEVRNA